MITILINKFNTDFATYSPIQISPLFLYSFKNNTRYTDLKNGEIFNCVYIIEM